MSDNPIDRNRYLHLTITFSTYMHDAILDKSMTILTKDEHVRLKL